MISENEGRSFGSSFQQSSINLYLLRSNTLFYAMFELINRDDNET